MSDYTKRVETDNCGRASKSGQVAQRAPEYSRISTDSKVKNRRPCLYCE